MTVTACAHTLPPELCSCGQIFRPGHHCPTQHTPEEGTHA